MRILKPATPIHDGLCGLLRPAAYLALASLGLALLTGCGGVSRREMLRETAGLALPGEADKEPGKATI